MILPARRGLKAQAGIQVILVFSGPRPSPGLRRGDGRVDGNLLSQRHSDQVPGDPAKRGVIPAFGKNFSTVIIYHSA